MKIVKNESEVFEDVPKLVGHIMKRRNAPKDLAEKAITQLLL